jgi:hypothetical protein
MGSADQSGVQPRDLRVRDRQGQLSVEPGPCAFVAAADDRLVDIGEREAKPRTERSPALESGDETRYLGRPGVAIAGGVAPGDRVALVYDGPRIRIRGDRASEFVAAVRCNGSHDPGSTGPRW